MNDHNSDACEAVLRSLSDGVLSTNKKGVISDVNPAAETLLATPLEDLTGLTLEEAVPLVNPKTGEPIRLPSPRSFQRRRDDAHTHQGVFLARRDGIRLMVDAEVLPLRGYRGSLSGSVLVLRDVTAQAVLERGRLDQQRISAIGDLAGNIARDFINWFGVISSHAASIADNVLPHTRAHDEARSILETSKQASGLTKRLLSVARAGSEHEPSVERIALGDIVTDAVSLAQGTFAPPEIAFSHPPVKMMPYVMADAAQLRDCLVNLFRNAADAMDNSGTITLEVSDKVEPRQRFTVLRVSDTGKGIEHAILESIFDPFFTTKEQGWAMGLGLTVVKTAVQAWGGRITVRSRPGDGSSFRLFIPKADVQNERGASEDDRTPVSVLVVDDNPSTLRSMAVALEDAGYDVLAANGGEKAITLFRANSERIAVSVVDVVMPEQDGKKVLEQLLDIDPTAQVVMTSGFSRDYVRGYLERGAWAFLQKPYAPDALLHTVKRTLDQRQRSTT